MRNPETPGSAASSSESEDSSLPELPMSNATSRRVRAVTTAAFVAAVVAGILLVAPAPAAGAPQILLAWPTHINAFAQDGPYVAWIARAPNTWSPRCGRTYIRSLATGTQRSFGTRTAPVCSGGVALGRNRALWTADAGLCGICQYSARVFTAALDDPRVVALATVVADWHAGTHLTGLAADWRLLAFSRVGYRQVETEPSCLEEPVPCVYDVTGGRATRVRGRDRNPVPGVAPPALLAVGAGRIAVAPSADPWEDSLDPLPAENGPINIVNPRTGTLLTSVSPTGTVRALALSADALAVLVQRTDGSLAIERYALPAGTLLASTTVNQRTAPRIDIGDKWIVYRVDRQIRLIGPGGASRPLIRTSRTLNTPMGLSIEGRRVAWATNGNGLHRIRALLAPH